MRKMLLLALLTVTFGGVSYAQGPSGFPNRPVKFLVTFAPGGPTDIGARLIAQKMSENLRQRVYVENQGGGGGNIGTANGAKAPPDGYTIVYVASPFVINPSLFEKVPYDPYKDFIPLTNVATAVNVLLVDPKLPVKTAKELVDFLRAGDGKYSFSTSGVGSASHIASELLKLTYKLDVVHVPYASSGPAAQSIAAGHTQFGFASLPATEGLISAGKLRAIAVANNTRMPTLPDVPTMLEGGLVGQESGVFQAALVPAGTPTDIAEFLYREIVKAVKSPDIAQKFAQLGLVIVASTPDQFAAQIREEIDKWGKVIKAADIKPR